MSSKVVKRRRSTTENQLRKLVHSTVCSNNDKAWPQGGLTAKKLKEALSEISSQKTCLSDETKCNNAQYSNKSFDESKLILNGTEPSISSKPCSVVSACGSENQSVDPPQDLQPSHKCEKSCWMSGTVLKDWHLYSHYEIPIKLGWKRIVSGSEPSPEVYYTAPCGKEMRSMEEILVFLLTTGVCEVHISQFTFDPLCQLETHSFSHTLCSEDISNGKESKAITCVNSVNDEKPEEFEYITEQTHRLNISLLADSNGVVCCSCTDGCRNRSQCECWQLTFKEAKQIPHRHTVGYVYGRLRDHQYSAIYECNPLCKCGPHCTNRLVQHGLVHRLQVFRSSIEELKWGVRSLDDIPQGSFVCTYIGHIYSEAESDQQADLHGDDYFAELDYIEVLQQHIENKGNLSADSLSSSPSSLHGSSLTSINLLVENCSPELSDIADYSDDELADTCLNTSSNPLPTELNSRVSVNSSIESIPPSLSPTSPHHISHTPSPLPHTSINLPPCFYNSSSQENTDMSPLPQSTPLSCSRICSPRKDGVYIMDAKDRGNIGRFINHSCSPNLFVQNVFIDTQDRRFPWVALFAKQRIKALEELTWDYNYQVGSLPQRLIKCLCGSSECRGRLL